MSKWTLRIVFVVCATLSTNCAALAAPASSSYFPPETFDDFLTRYYDLKLLALREPSLSAERPQNPVLRFLWIRSFHNTVSIRVDVKSEKEASLTLKALSGDLFGNWGYFPGGLWVNESRTLGEAEISLLRGQIEFLGDCVEPPQEVGFDGANWVFETRAGSEYCAVHQWSPSDGRWREIGELLIDLSGYEVPEEEVY